MSIFSKGSSQWVPRYNGIQIQSSSSAIPIPIVYGTNRIAPNILWTGGFRSYPQRSGGGKGGGQVTGYDYQTDMVIGLCEGPIWSYGTVWNGNDIVPLNGNGLYFGNAYVGTTPGDNFTNFQEGGLANESIWPNEGTTFGSQGLYYPGIAYLCSSDMDLGTSGTMPSLAFELYAVLQGTAGVPSGGIPPYGVQDADPARCIYDFLTNAQYGVGFPAVSIDLTTLYAQSPNDSSYQNYCFTTGFSLSPCLVDQEAANSILARWLQLTNSTAIWSEGLLKFIPYGDTVATGNSSLSVAAGEQFTGGQGTYSTATFTPNITPVYNLGANDFVNDGDADPVICIRSNPYTAYNMQSVIALDRAYYYSPTTIAAFDQNAIDAYGLRIGSSISANEICALDVAQKSAQLILQRGLYIRNTYQFKLSFEYCLIDPMDIVTLTEPLIGLNNTPVRITSIEEDDAGLLSFTAEEFPEGVGTATSYNVQVSAATIKSVRYAVPSPVNTPIIFEPPASLTNGATEIWAAVSGGYQPVYLMTEDTSAGAHSVAWKAPAGFSTQTETVSATFSVSIGVPAGGPEYVSIQAYDGANTSQVDFTLISAGTAEASTSSTQYWSNYAITAEIVGGVTYYVLSVELPIPAASGSSASPYQMLFTLFMASAPGTLTYTGSGAGLYVWGPELSNTSEQALSFNDMIPLETGVASFTPQPSTQTPQGASGYADPNWGGCYIWSSSDNTNYHQIGQITQPSRQGLLTAPLPAFTGSNPDGADKCSVSLVESAGALASGTKADAQNGVTLCVAGNGTNFELFSYETAALMSLNSYNLTNLYRGLYGTSPTNAWAANTQFARLDSNIFTYSLPSALTGVQLYFKFQSYNIYGNSVQDLFECAVYTYTPTGDGMVGPVASALLLGLDLDYGLAGAAVTESDDWGTAPSSTTNTIIDLGTPP